MEDDDIFAKKEDLTNKLIEQHKQLKKENSELHEKLNKTKISSEAELNIEKEKLKKAYLEIAQSNQANKELRNQLQQCDSKLQAKDREIKDLKSRLDIKNLMDSKNQERDLQLFQKQIGRQPISTNSSDSKMLSIIRVYENQKERYEQEIKDLRKDNENIRNRIFDYENDVLLMRKDLTSTKDKVTADFIEKLTQLEDENTILLRKNEDLKDDNEKLIYEFRNLEKEHRELKFSYENLRIELVRIKNGTPSKNNDQSIAHNSGQPEEKIQTHMKKDHSHHSGKKHRLDDQFDIMNANKPFVELSELTLLEARRLIGDVLEVFGLSSPSQILPALEKTQKAIKAIPKLQNFISDVCEIVLVSIGYPNDLSYLEHIMPALRNWSDQIRQIDEIKERIMILRKQLIQLLELDNDIGDHQILKKVQNLLSHYKKMSTKEEVEAKMIFDQFTKMFGTTPDVAFFRQIANQLNDINQFIMYIKSSLGLDPNMKNEACFTYLLKFVDKHKNKQENNAK